MGIKRSCPSMRMPMYMRSGSRCGVIRRQRGIPSGGMRGTLIWGWKEPRSSGRRRWHPRRQLLNIRPRISGTSGRTDYRSPLPPTRPSPRMRGWTRGGTFSCPLAGSTSPLSLVTSSNRSAPRAGTNLRTTSLRPGVEVVDGVPLAMGILQASRPWLPRRRPTG